MMTFPIIFISLFTVITADQYCNQQLQIVQTAAYNLKEKCTTTNTMIQTCCDLNAFYFFTKPSGVYQMDCWCGGKWNTADVFCDTDGWTVIQRRQDGSVDFNRLWVDYKKGFGDLNGEFWYGLRAINCLTQTGLWELRIDFEFMNKTRSYLHYNTFKVGDDDTNYQLTIGGFTGITPTDPFATHSLNGKAFSTYDNDNDLSRSRNCALQVDNAKGNGGWWYNDCWHINLNINYNPAQYGSIYLSGTWYNPRWIEIKIRPIGCKPQ
ncbi:ryncolin-1-like [Dysidea avara]|uniref:ryncolin-1-like n=1 Tax=Dysidea avara TaxID=196820 RepID=UPI003326088C